MIRFVDKSGRAKFVLRDGDQEPKAIVDVGEGEKREEEKEKVCVGKTRSDHK